MIQRHRQYVLRIALALTTLASLAISVRADVTVPALLADHMVVDGADLQNGLLHVGLKRVVPEALKPHQITIGAGRGQQVIANDPQGTAQAA